MDDVREVIAEQLGFDLEKVRSRAHTTNRRLQPRQCLELCIDLKCYLGLPGCVGHS